MPISTIGQAGLDAPISLTSPTLTTPNINSAQIPTVSGTAPLYMCRAWVNFNGTGTVAIRASGNVSSITDQAVGKYSINMTTALPDANFAFSASSGPNGLNPNAYVSGPDGDYTLSTSSFAINVRNDGASLVDQSWVNVTVFR